MEPFFKSGTVTLYHGDCIKLRDEVVPPDAIIVSDPPYGIGNDGDYSALGNASASGKFKPIHGDTKPFDPTPWLDYPNVILFGANHYANKLPLSSQWLVWDKRQVGKHNGEITNQFADCELAWVKEQGPARMFRLFWMGMLRDTERGKERVHPTMKPLALMEWVILNFVSKGALICDPYMGSGTTLLAAMNAGHPAIGIDIEKDYCEVAERRIRSNASQPAFFSAREVYKPPVRKTDEEKAEDQRRHEESELKKQPRVC
jgi:site-specific DNA-methyltransferase (adenine-specific)/modification methylase